MERVFSSTILLLSQRLTHLFHGLPSTKLSSTILRSSGGLSKKSQTESTLYPSLSCDICARQSRILSCSLNFLALSSDSVWYAYISKKAAIPAAIGVANDVPDLHRVHGFSHSALGQADSTASPSVRKL